MSLQAVLAHRLEVASCFALSSFLCEGSQVYSALSAEDEKRPPVYMSWGTEDSLVMSDWAENTRHNLTQRGLSVTHSVVKGLAHEMETQQIKSLFHWINEAFS